MSAPFRRALIVFVSVWLLACAFDAVAYLHWPNPLAWSHVARGVVFLESIGFASIGFITAKMP